jgi:hypothetical protein
MASLPSACMQAAAVFQTEPAHASSLCDALLHVLGVGGAGCLQSHLHCGLERREMGICMSAAAEAKHGGKGTL